MNCNRLISYYSGNKDSREFRCHEKDADTPNLKYENLKVLEKNLKLQEMIHGAIGMATTSIMMTVEEVVNNLRNASSDFLGSKEMVDPRQDASDICLDLQDTLTKQISTLG